MEGIAVRGRLHSMSLTTLLQWIDNDGKTGTLILNQGRISKKIVFRGGRIVSTSSNDPREYFGQFLLSEGLISEEQLRSAMDLQKNSRMMLGKILLEGGIIREKELTTLLVKKAEEMISNLLLWEQGVFQFQEGEAHRRAEVSFSLEIDKLLQEGKTRRERLRKIREVFPSDRVVLVRTGKVPGNKALAQPVVKKVFLLVDGQRSIADLSLEVRLPEFTLSWILLQMFERGFLAVAEEMVSRVPTREAANSVLLEQTKGMLKREEFEPALVLLEQIRITNPDDPEVPVLLQQAENGFQAWASREIGAPGRVPVLTRPADALKGEKLTSEEGFLISRLDGQIDVESLIHISPIREVDILRILKNLNERGIVMFQDRAPEAAETPSIDPTPDIVEEPRQAIGTPAGNGNGGGRPAQEMKPVFNRLGWAVGWWKEDVVFDHEGHPRACIRDGSVFHFKGGYLGQFDGGFFRDRKGHIVAFVEGATGGPFLPATVVPPAPPALSPVPGFPKKTRIPPRPATPNLGWSSQDFSRYLRID